MSWDKELDRTQSPEYVVEKQALLNFSIDFVKKRLPTMSSDEMKVRLIQLEESEEIYANLKAILVEELVNRSASDTKPESCPDCKQSPCVAGEWTCT